MDISEWFIYGSQAVQVCAILYLTVQTILLNKVYKRAIQAQLDAKDEHIKDLEARLKSLDGEALLAQLQAVKGYNAAEKETIVAERDKARKELEVERAKTKAKGEEDTERIKQLEEQVNDLTGRLDQNKKQGERIQDYWEELSGKGDNPWLYVESLTRPLTKPDSAKSYAALLWALDRSSNFPKGLADLAAEKDTSELEDAARKPKLTNDND